MKIVTNHFNDESLIAELEKISIPSGDIRIAVAFFNNAELIERMACKSAVNVHLVVSLRPPTDYYALKKIYWRKNVTVTYLSSEFHSKIYLFDSKGSEREFFVSVGSSNLTNGGLANNIETNVLLERREAERVGISNHFEFIVNSGELLTPEILEEYKHVFDKFIKNPPNNVNFRKTQPLSAFARGYVDFWKSVDYVKSLVQDTSTKKFGNFPVYMAIDHFWHYIVVVCEKQGINVAEMVSKNGRELAVKTLFQQYCLYEGQTNFHEEMQRRHNLIQELLSSEDVIKELTREQARTIFSCLHATGSTIKRFKSDQVFLSNGINRIRKSFSFLIHGPERIERRIEKVLDQNSGYRLNQFGKSAVQELNGWYAPDKFPIRNQKANKALNLLGIS
jgi:hypothetical protein